MAPFPFDQFQSALHDLTCVNFSNSSIGARRKIGSGIAGQIKTKQRVAFLLCFNALKDNRQCGNCNEQHCSYKKEYCFYRKEKVQPII
jgi:hypothetical protein